MSPHRHGRALLATLIVLAVIALVVLFSGTYTLDETKQAVIMRFGEAQGTVKEAGLHWKVPFVDEARTYEKRILIWDGEPNEIPTKGRQFISVDTTARWRIEDPQSFLETVRDEGTAQSRLDDSIDSSVRDQIASTELKDIVRSADWDVSKEDLELTGTLPDEELTAKVEVGRKQLTEKILKASEQELEDAGYGIKLVDFRIKRLNYIEKVRERVYERMRSERKRIAQRLRSEGEGAASEILGNMEKELNVIRSEAEKEAEKIRGKADAEAARIYNEAYGADPSFYRFYRTLQSYEDTIDNQTTLMLGADSAYFRFLQEIRGAKEEPKKDAQPAKGVASP